MSDEAKQAIADLRWWHMIEVAPGVTTPGPWNLRPTAARLPWPGPLTGLRCLDVGTMDGFWAFEMERRGAAEVTAMDVVPARRTFEVAAELLDSKVRYRELSVYDLDPRDVGEFDVVVMGYVLQMLRDPMRGLEAIRGVCRGHLILLDTISLPLSLIPSPVARLDARRDGTEWFVFNRRGMAKALELAAFEVEAVTPILRDRYAPPAPGERRIALGARAMYRLGTRGRSAAIRAKPAIA